MTGKSKYSGHDLLRVVPYGQRAHDCFNKIEYFGAAASEDWNGFLASCPILCELEKNKWSVARNNLTHRLCGQELKNALLRANAKAIFEAGDNGDRLLRTAHEHSLIHDFFFNTYSIFEGVFSLLASGDDRDAWKKEASRDVFDEDWCKEGSCTLYRDVIELRDRIHQDKAGDKQLEFDDSSYNGVFRQNLCALQSLMRYLDDEQKIIPSDTNLFEEFIPKDESFQF